MLVFFLTGFLLLSSCQKSEPPIKVGFLGCLTGRSTDLGVAGRDGFLLSINEVNAAGGIAGRKIIPVVRDDGLDPEKVKVVLRELLDEGVSFIVGPMTSQMAMTVVPEVKAAKIPLISPTVSTNQLIGLDDYFFRVYYANSQAAKAMADYVKTSGLKTVVALYDTRNLAYTEDWVRIFTERFSGDGRQVEAVPFNAATVGSFYDLVSLIKDKNPDGLLILANSIDTALVCQQAMKLNLLIPKFATGWSYSGKLITYGGKSVEGLVLVQSADLKKDRPELQRFLKAFRNGYFVDPTFPAVHAYDATRLGLHALEKLGVGGDLKQELLSIKSFPGILQDFALDEYGDVINPPIYFMKIDEAVFHSL